MSGRESKSANTRHPERPPRKPGRLDQFADDLRDQEEIAEEIAEELGVTGRRRVRALTRPPSVEERERRT